jgi:DNA-binding PadR family transcriptional regulator
MSHGPPVSAQSALLRVLITGESEGPEIVRKVRDWTNGQIQLDEHAFTTAMDSLEKGGLIEHRSGAVDKRTGQPRLTFTLTAEGKAAALEVLAASLTRKA